MALTSLPLALFNLPKAAVNATRSPSPSPSAQYFSRPDVKNPAPPQASNKGNYWVGADGNVYTQNTGQTSANNLGQSSSLYQRGFDALNGYQNIADPNPPSPSTPTSPPPNQTGQTGRTYEDTSAARAATLKNINILPGLLQNSLKSLQQDYDDILAGYGIESEKNANEYKTQRSANEETRSRTNQMALTSAAQGARGLRATLASLGALGGTGSLLANRAVAKEANRDIGESERTFDKNATQIEKAYTDTTEDEARRKEEANRALQSQKNAAYNSNIQQQESLYQQMAQLFDQAGNKGEANRYITQAGDLAPQKLQYSSPVQYNYPTNQIAFNAGQLQTYLGARNAPQVTGGKQSAAPINSPLYALTRRREEMT